MSIVEKALQKAQAKAERPASAEPAPPAAEAPPESVVFDRRPPPAHETAPSPVRAPTRPQQLTVVSLDIEQLRRDGRLAPEALSHQTEEEFRRIKWPVLNSIAHREGARPADNNIALVTSAIPGEGKTFTALNLALSIARDRDLEVLLVDGDVAEPALTASLGLAGRPGLTDLLRDVSLSLDEVVYATNVPRLHLLPAGARHENAPELLAGSRMVAIAAELCARAAPGVVIVDSPPILATNEAQVMSRYAGQVLMVVRADATEQRVVTEALSLLDHSRPINAVLNRVEPSLVSKYYSHYYYGYGKDHK
jgi:exopolysaccharide/PEP-CTERM locus tyrosine autokinase